MIEAAERGCNLLIRCKLAALGLVEALQDSGEMCGVDRLRLAMICRKLEHGTRDLVLAVRR